MGPNELTKYKLYFFGVLEPEACKYFSEIVVPDHISCIHDSELTSKAPTFLKHCKKPHAHFCAYRQTPDLVGLTDIVVQFQNSCN